MNEPKVKLRELLVGMYKCEFGELKQKLNLFYQLLYRKKKQLHL